MKHWAYLFLVEGGAGLGVVMHFSLQKAGGGLIGEGGLIEKLRYVIFSKNDNCTVRVEVLYFTLTSGSAHAWFINNNPKCPDAAVTEKQHTDDSQNDFPNRFENGITRSSLQVQCNLVSPQEMNTSILLL